METDIIKDCERLHGVHALFLSHAVTSYRFLIEEQTCTCIFNYIWLCTHNPPCHYGSY